MKSPQTHSMHTMKKRMNTKAPLLVGSPSPTPPLDKSPNSSILRKRSSGKKKQWSPEKTLTSVSDLRDLACSRLDDLKRQIIDRSHSHILQDLEASNSCLHKRFKIQNQTWQQAMDEAEKDFMKMSERINENCEAMKESYTEFMADAEATNSRVCKSMIPEVSKSIENAISGLQSRFGISSS